MRKVLLIIIGLLIQQLAIAQNLIFKDADFKNAVLNYEPRIDLNQDGEIQSNEADSVTILNLMKKNIHSMEDAYLFPNLIELALTTNEIAEVKLIGLMQLKRFSCAANKVTYAEVKNMPQLERLWMNFNQIDTIILDSLPKLKSLALEGNKLTNINLSPFPLLENIGLSDNQLKKIDITQNLELIQLMIADNPLIELDIRSNTKLKTHILYVDSSVKLITTSSQQKAIEQRGLGVTFSE